VNVEVLRTDTQDINDYSNWLKERDGRRAKICQIQLPSRVK